MHDIIYVICRRTINNTTINRGKDEKPYLINPKKKDSKKNVRQSKIENKL